LLPWNQDLWLLAGGRRLILSWVKKDARTQQYQSNRLVCRIALIRNYWSSALIARSILDGLIDVVSDINLSIFHVDHPNDPSNDLFQP
jgi:hypothetical protein